MKFTALSLTLFLALFSTHVTASTGCLKCQKIETERASQGGGDTGYYEDRFKDRITPAANPSWFDQYQAKKAEEEALNPTKKVEEQRNEVIQDQKVNGKDLKASEVGLLETLQNNDNSNKKDIKSPSRPNKR